MKEQIYTIPINEAYEEDSECLFCLLEKRYEEEAVDYTLGAAMMEPDFRIESNEKGYCNRHFSMLGKKSNKLGLALIMETLIKENITELEKFQKKTESLKKERGGLFKKQEAKEFAGEFLKMLKSRNESCLICDRLEYTMKRYFEVFLDMWKTEPEFRKRIVKSKGFCLKHTEKLVCAAQKQFSDKTLREFLVFLYDKQQKELDRIYDDVHKFTLKFDYRNKDMEWGTAQDAPIRSTEKLSGFIEKS